MITIIHGDDIVTSRKHFIEEKQKVYNAQILSGESIVLTDLIQMVEGSLFAKTQNLFIENLFASRKKEELKHVLTFLTGLENVHTLVWEGKELTSSALSPLPKVKVLAFNLPKTLFSFLDSLKPGNGKDLVLAFHTLLKETEAELVFYMLVRQFRILLALSSRGSVSIDEVIRLAPWQRERLARQSSMFSSHQLKHIYRKLYKMDLLQKTGRSPLTLSQNIDIFLLDL